MKGQKSVKVALSRLKKFFGTLYAFRDVLVSIRTYFPTYIIAQVFCLLMVDFGGMGILSLWAARRVVGYPVDSR